MSGLIWDLKALHRHLQGVIDLEMYTIPYYLTVLYSIKDPSAEAYRLIQSAVYQEMLHCQLACNIANAYGHRPRFRPPRYGTGTVPHVDFDLDDPNPTTIYTPYSTALGPLDEERLNTMCLIEYPEWDTGRTPDLRARNEEYGSIGEFYDAVRLGLAELRHHCRAGVKQVDEFGRFYINFDQPTITRDGEEGYKQAVVMMQVIVDQGEGQTQEVPGIPADFQNTADGYQESWPHFRKFNWIRDQAKLPATWSGVARPERGSPGFAAQRTLIKDFRVFLTTLERLFSGHDPGNFGPLMAKLGGDVLTCWQRNAIPRFALSEGGEVEAGDDED